MRLRTAFSLLALSLGLTLAGTATAASDVKTTEAAPPQAAPVNPDYEARRERALRMVEARKGRKSKLERTSGITNAWQAQMRDPRGLEARFDEPQGALTHFIAKRAPAGVTVIDQRMYDAGLAQAARMPVFSSVDNRFQGAPGPSRTVTRDGTSQQVLGTWQALGPGNIGGRTRALLIHPTSPNIIWAAGVAGGIWKSTDGGSTWTPKADLLVNIAVNSMVLDPRNPNILYAGTGEGFFNGDAVRGAGILKSTDGGETWALLPSTGNSDFHYVQKVVVSRGASQRVYAATRTGIFRSVDAGASWTKVLDATAVNGCMDLVIQTDRALANVFAACGSFAQAAVWRALDTTGAQTWNKVFEPVGMGRTSLALAPSNQNIIYALAASITAGSYNNGMLGVYRSTASGASGSWTTRVDNTSPTRLNTLLLSNTVYGFLADCGFGGANQFLNQGWYDNIIAVDPVNPDIVWAGGVDLFRSDDGGANWGQASHWWFNATPNTEYNHADHHAIVFHPQYNGTTNKTMYTGNDGGVHVTVDARAPVAYSPSPVTPASPVCGNTPAGLVKWSPKNTGYAITQFYHGAVYPDGETFVGGTQDNGTLRGTSAAGIDGWATIRGGDGGYVAVNPSNTQQVWAENTSLSIQRSDNGGASWTAVTSGITEPSGNFLFIAPFLQDPTSPSRMYIGGARVWRASNATAIPAPNPYWTQVSQFLGFRVSALAVSPVDPNRAYAGTAANGAVFTTNVATTATATTVWTASAPRADTNTVSWVAADPVNAGTVYATVSTFNTAGGVGHVFKSTNAGATWTSIDGSGATGVPDVPVHCIVVDPANNQRLYIGTDIGVFVSVDGGANWARENTGFANVIVESMAITSGSPRRIVAFSHGRSVFRATLP